MANARALFVLILSVTQVAALLPDCSYLFDKPWTGGQANARVIGGEEYGWSFHPCEPQGKPQCDTPPYSGSFWVTQLNPRESQPCYEMLFCQNEPAVAERLGTGVVKYDWPTCVNRAGEGHRGERSAEMHIHCDSQQFRVDPVEIRSVPPHGLHFVITVHGDCGNGNGPSAPALPPSPAPPCPEYLQGTAADYFTLPLNNTSGNGDEVFYWGVNLCTPNSLLFPGQGYINMANQETGDRTVLDVSKGATMRNGKYKFSYSSSSSTATAVVEVQAVHGSCDWLSAPESVQGSLGPNGGAFYSMVLECHTKP